MTFSQQLTLLFIIAATLQALALGSRVEPETKLVRDDPTKAVAMLNRYTFNAQVQQEHVDDWIVYFCVDWLPVCQGLWHHYKNAAVHWEDALSSKASSWQSSAVRFAEVDCATDKALCNENNVTDYPFAIHFRGGEFVSNWEIYEHKINKEDGLITSASKDLFSWMGLYLKDKLKATTSQACTGGFSIASHLGELSQIVSWKAEQKSPVHTIFGYFVLAAAVVSFGWTVFTGLELELKSTLSALGKEAKDKSRSLLPEFPAMPASRTIVRANFEL